VNRRFVIRDPSVAEKAVAAVLAAASEEEPHDVVISPHVDLRTTPQNALYWSALNDRLAEVGRLVGMVADNSGHSNLEARRALAHGLPGEVAALLFVHSGEAAHEILKLIHGIPTTTKLSKRTFTEFYDRMETTFADLVGHINAAL